MRGWLHSSISLSVVLWGSGASGDFGPEKTGWRTEDRQAAKHTCLISSSFPSPTRVTEGASAAESRAVGRRCTRTPWSDIHLYNRDACRSRGRTIAAATSGSGFEFPARRKANGSMSRSSRWYVCLIRKRFATPDSSGWETRVYFETSQKIF